MVDFLIPGSLDRRVLDVVETFEKRTGEICAFQSRER
jgi:hypothetical protein